MRNLTRLLVLIGSMAALLALSACGASATTSGGNLAVPTPTPTTPPIPTATATSSAKGAATLTMGSFSFAGSTSLHIRAGQAVTFSDPSASGGIHDLVTGTNGTFASASGAPSEFGSSSGVMVSPGDSKTITFPTAGTYSITCTIHPTMQAKITVA